MIKNVVFDFGNVIVKWDVDAILQKYVLRDEERKALKTAIFESKEWLQMDEGLVDARQAERIFRDAVPDTLKDRVTEVMVSWYEKVEFNQEVCGLIKRLKKDGFRVYGLSNTNLPFYEHLKGSEVGKYFDGFVISAVEKLMKPDEEIFRRLFRKFSLNPEECFFVDDTEENVLAAARLGMDGFVFDIERFGELEHNLSL